MTLSRPVRTLTFVAAVAAALAPVALAPSAIAAPALTDSARTALDAGIADEYRAEAFYAAVIDKFGAVRPFANVIRAEQIHAAMLTGVMKTYGVTPAPNPWLGSAEIAALVPATIGEACALGVKAEIDNKALYDGKLIPAAAGHADVVAVFQQLRDASQNNHLPAFQRCAAR